MRVLVTGGSGFIGQAVIRRLESVLGASVVVFDRSRREPAHYSGSVEVQLGDIRDATAITESVAHVDAVIHLAGVLGTAETITNPIPAAETNVLGGLNVLQAVAQYQVPMVNIAVGNWWESSSYSITKNTVERFSKMYRQFRDTPVTTVRALNAVGPGQSVAAPFGSSKVRKIGPSFICRALTGQAIEVYGSGEQVMDVIHVGDVARVLIAALEYTMHNGGYDGVFEAGTGAHTTVNQIAQEVVTCVESVYGHPCRVEHIPLRDGETPGAVVQADVTTLEPLGPFGINPGEFRTLRDVVTETVPYYHDYLSQHPDWREVL